MIQHSLELFDLALAALLAVVPATLPLLGCWRKAAALTVCTHTIHADVYMYNYIYIFTICIIIYIYMNITYNYLFIYIYYVLLYIYIEMYIV